MGSIEWQDDGSVVTRMPYGYFDEVRCAETWRGTDSRNGERFEFPLPFTFYHRPLSSYWKAIHEAGFRVLDLDEPVVSESQAAEQGPDDAKKARQVAWSLAFHLQAER